MQNDCRRFTFTLFLFYSVDCHASPPMRMQTDYQNHPQRQAKICLLICRILALPDLLHAHQQRQAKICLLICGILALPGLLHAHQLVLPRAQPDPFGVLQTHLPAGIGRYVVKMVVTSAALGVGGQMLAQNGIAHRRRGVHEIGAGLSSATGSKEASMPISATTGASFSPWQSQ